MKEIPSYKKSKIWWLMLHGNVWIEESTFSICETNLMWAVKVKNEERRRVTWPLPCLFNWSVTRTTQAISDKSRRNLVKIINDLQHLHFLFASFVNHFSGSFECWKTSLSIHPHEIPLIYYFKQPKILKKKNDEREPQKKRKKTKNSIYPHKSRW